MKVFRKLIVAAIMVMMILPYFGNRIKAESVIEFDPNKYDDFMSKLNECKDGYILRFMNDYNSEFTWEINKNITIDLNNHKIHRYSNEESSPSRSFESGRIFIIKSRSNVTIQNGTMEGGLIDTGESYEGGAGIIVENGAELTLENVTLSGNKVYGNGNGGAIWVGSGSILNLNNSTISNNHVSSDGYGGGINADDGSTVNITGSTISSNTAMMGGGIAVGQKVKVIMANSLITNNTSSYGGGGVVLSRNGSVFKMNGGSITKNTANGKLRSDGRLTNGAGGGGVFLFRPNGNEEYTFSVSGNANITENTLVLTGDDGVVQASENDVYLYNGATFTIEGEKLDEKARIGVSGGSQNAEDIQAGTIVVTNAKGRASSENIFSTNYLYQIQQNEDGHLYMANIPVTVHFDTTGGTVMEPGSVQVNKGSTMSEPEAIPVKNNLVFDGWYKDPYAETRWDFRTDRVYGNADNELTIYAGWRTFFEPKWDQKIARWTLEDHGTADRSSDKLSIELLKFNGTDYVAVEGSQKELSLTDTSYDYAELIDTEYKNNNATQFKFRLKLTCKEQGRAHVYTEDSPEAVFNEVNFHKNADAAVIDYESAIYKVDEKYAQFPEVKYDGHSFAGWFTQTEGGKEISAGDLADKTITDLYAHWSNEHYHDHTTFTAWTSDNSLPSFDDILKFEDSTKKIVASYYLTKDISLSDSWDIALYSRHSQYIGHEVVVNLCLNGHTITDTSNDGVPPFHITGSKHTLNIYDCEETGSITNGEPSAIRIDGGATVNMYGGKITGNRASSMTNVAAGVTVNDGLFRMYGGEISNNTATQGLAGGIYLSYEEQLELYGGTITDNTGVKAGGIYSNGTLFLNVEKLPAVVTIDGNKNSTGKKSNVYLPANRIINAFVAPHPKTRISVTTEEIPIGDKKIDITGTFERSYDYENFFSDLDYVVKYPERNIEGPVQLTSEQSARYHTITIAEGIQHGTLYSSKETAEKGETIKIGVTPDDGYEYELDTMKVIDSQGASVSVLNNKFTMPNYDVTVSAKFKCSTYLISYDLDGGSVAEENPTSYNIGSNSITLNNPTKEHSVFLGWTGTDVPNPSNSVTIPTGSFGDREYKANWETEKFTVSFYDEDGKTLLQKSQFEYEAKPVYNGSVPVKQGDAEFSYAFDGWYNGETKLDDTTIVTGEISYKARYTETKNKYTINFYDEDGSTLLQSLEVEYGKTPVYSETEPVKQADAQYTYKFNGWDPAITDVTGNASYKAKYDKTLNKYTITWKNGETTLETDENVKYGSTPVYNGSTPTKAAEGDITYTFAGWDPEISEVTGNQAYTAKFVDSTKKYNVIWLDDDMASVIHEQENNITMSQINKIIAEIGTPTKTSSEYNYTFLNWNTRTVGNVLQYIATYSASPKKFTVTWKDGDGTVLKTEEVAYGVTPVYSGNTPGKTADAQYTYEFKDWGRGNPHTTISNTTYVAEFTSVPRTYKISFKDGDGNVLKTDTMNYGATPSYSGAEPTKASDEEHVYKFNNTWDPQISSVTGDKTYIAQFDALARKFNVTFVNLDGSTLGTSQTIYGTVPEYNGPKPVWSDDRSPYTYEFSGWEPELGTVYGETTYKAKYDHKGKTFKVSFDMNDGSEPRQVVYMTIGYDETIPQPQDSVKEGYNFAGWYTSDDAKSKWDFNTKIKGEVNLKAQWYEKSVPSTINGTEVMIASNNIEGKSGVSNKYNDKPLLIKTNNGVIVLPANLNDPVDIPNISTDKNYVSLDTDISKGLKYDIKDRMYGIYLKVDYTKTIDKNINNSDKTNGYTEVKDSGFTAEFRNVTDDSYYYYPGKVSLTVNLAEMGTSLPVVTSNDYVRTFYGAHNYSGKNVEYLNVFLSDSNKKATLTTNGLSPFAIVYKDTKRSKPSSNTYTSPKTGD